MVTFQNCEIFSTNYFLYVRDYKAALSDGNNQGNKHLLAKLK